MIDFEDKIPCYSIKNCFLELNNNFESGSKNVTTNAKKINDSIEDNIPILIKHLLAIKFCNENYEFGKNLSLFNIKFKTVTIYGNCIQILCPNKEKFKFVIDDGTGVILVKYPVKEQIKYEKKILHLKEEYTNCYENKNNINSNNNELKGSLKRLLSLTENQIKQIRDIKIGDQVSIVGIPYKIVRTPQHYDICIHAHEIKLITEQSRDKELFFKKNLIYYYTNRYKCASLD